MSSFFHQQARIMTGKHTDSCPLLKINRLPDWQPVGQLPNRQKTRYIRGHRGRPAYPLPPVLKAVLPGQWHSLSDPESERCLATRPDFCFFCGFDKPALPDHSTPCRFRNRPAQDDALARLPELINRRLTEKGLKTEKAPAAVIDAAIIQTAGGKQRQAVETDENGITAETLPGKDKDARRVKKEGRFTPADARECNHFEPLPEGTAPGTTVYADKGYDSKANREHLQSKRLSGGMMRKAQRGKPLTEQEKQRNTQLSEVRCAAGQTFGTPHRKSGCKRARYFGLRKVPAQSHLKAVCLNLPKAAGRLRVPAAA
ncbi:transposase [Neisseria weixii]|uniref:transposase n=1 Tax=Neisseria weixii TaxID=1853276 RepID=UPI000BB6D311|nr:transposase [Neisseria weixii]ATD64416.1 IS5/IS1182 family transposase [Neisseria weixii]ATD65567.1 IS5/IS1182 family transposase [Neisseria weixii]